MSTLPRWHFVGDHPHLHGEDRGLEADDLNIIQLDSYGSVPCSYSMSTWAHPQSQAPQRVLSLFSSGNRQSGSQTPPLLRPLPLRSLCKEFLTSISQPSVQMHNLVLRSAFAAVQPSLLSTSGLLRFLKLFAHETLTPRSQPLTPSILLPIYLYIWCLL